MFLVRKYLLHDCTSNVIVVVVAIFKVFNFIIVFETKDLMLLFLYSPLLLLFCCFVAIEGLILLLFYWDQMFIVVVVVLICVGFWFFFWNYVIVDRNLMKVNRLSAEYENEVCQFLELSERNLPNDKGIFYCPSKKCGSTKKTWKE